MRGDENINQYDLISINSVIEQLAAQKRFNRENAYFLLEKEFKVQSATKIKRCDFERAIAFLVDLQNVSIH